MFFGLNILSPRAYVQVVFYMPCLQHAALFDPREMNRFWFL